MDSSSWRSYRIMAGDKDIQAQDQAHQVQGYCAVVDDNMGDSCCVCYHHATFNGQHIMGLTGKKNNMETENERVFFAFT